MAGWFERLFLNVPHGILRNFATPAAIFALGDLICNTFFQLAFGRGGLKISTRLFYHEGRERKGEL